MEETRGLSSDSGPRGGQAIGLSDQEELDDKSSRWQCWLVTLQVKTHRIARHIQVEAYHGIIGRLRFFIGLSSQTLLALAR